MIRVAVVGGGAWGTALAHALATRGHDVRLWAREADVIEHVNLSHANPRFLPGGHLHEGVRAFADFPGAVGGATCVVFAAPSHVLRAVVRHAAPAIDSAAIQVVATKGIERDTLRLMTDVVAEELPGRPVVALSGPSFAQEVVRGQPTAIVAASHDHAASQAVQQALSSATLRIYTNDDVTGVELGGALKNVMAVATGIA